MLYQGSMWALIVTKLSQEPSIGFAKRGNKRRRVVWHNAASVIIGA
jgi:hypothetical protein